MSEFKQLHMRCPSLENLPPLCLKPGFGIHTHYDGCEEIWEDIIEKAFGSHFSFGDWLMTIGGYAPEFVHYATIDGRDVATAMGTEHPKFPGEGWFRMIGALPEAKGTGAAKLACLAAMHSLKGRGYNTCVLSTDDYRLPAISLYLSLGFEPIIFDEEHAARWNAVRENIAAYKSSK